MCHSRSAEKEITTRTSLVSQDKYERETLNLLKDDYLLFQSYRRKEEGKRERGKEKGRKGRRRKRRNEK